MRIEVSRQDCPGFSVDVSDCALCVKKYLAAPDQFKPCCFHIREEDLGTDLVVWIKNGDFFKSPEREPIHAISHTDWLD